MVALEALLLPVRAVQAAFSIIVLGTLAASASDWDHFFYYTTPSEISFGIFCAVWTWLALAYLILAPMFVPAAHHHFAVLAVEAVTMIFWFACFIALAASLGNSNCVSYFHTCKTAAAGDAFAALEWVLFVFTLVVAAMASFGRRGATKSTTTSAPAMTVP